MLEIKKMLPKVNAKKYPRYIEGIFYQSLLLTVTNASDPNYIDFSTPKV